MNDDPISDAWIDLAARVVAYALWGAVLAVVTKATWLTWQDAVHRVHRDDVGVVAEPTR